MWWVRRPVDVVLLLEVRCDVHVHTVQYIQYLVNDGQAREGRCNAWSDVASLAGERSEVKISELEMEMGDGDGDGDHHIISYHDNERWQRDFSDMVWYGMVCLLYHHGSIDR